MPTYGVTITITDYCEIEADTEAEARTAALDHIPDYQIFKDPEGLKEIMVVETIDDEPTEPTGGYSHHNEQAEQIRRMENPEISGAEYPPDPYDDY